MHNRVALGSVPDGVPSVSGRLVINAENHLVSPRLEMPVLCKWAAAGDRLLSVLCVLRAAPYDAQ